jgi:hypothetical protein
MPILCWRAQLFLVPSSGRRGGMSRASPASYSCAINIDCGHAFSTSPDPFIIVAGHARDVIVGGGGDAIVSEGVCVDLAFFLMRPFHRVTVNRDPLSSRPHRIAAARSAQQQDRDRDRELEREDCEVADRTEPDRALEVPTELRRSPSRLSILGGGIVEIQRSAV